MQSQVAYENRTVTGIGHSAKYQPRGYPALMISLIQALLHYAYCVKGTNPQDANQITFSSDGRSLNTVVGHWLGLNGLLEQPIEGRPQKRSATPISYKVSQCPKKFLTSNCSLKNA